MPFPIDTKYITEMENSMGVKFPEKFVNKMRIENGGEIELEDYHFGEMIFEDYHFILYPFYDKTDRNRIKRTCNHIESQTKSAREWSGFPQECIAIGEDGSGNYLVMLSRDKTKIAEEIYFWNHETRRVNQIANSIDELTK